MEEMGNHIDWNNQDLEILIFENCTWKQKEAI